MNNKPGKCYFPFVASAILPDGLGYCCMPNTKIFPKDQSIEDVFKSDFMKDLRSQMLGLKEVNDSCKKCMDIWGDTLYHSSHIPTYEVDIDFDITVLSIARNNKCNQACRMCAPRLSTQLGSLYKKYDIGEDVGEVEYDVTDIISKYHNDIKYVEISGGLPILDDGLHDVLTKLNPDVVETITITTNGTTWSDEFLSVMTRFYKASITFCFSIDGDAEVSESLRLFSKNDRTYKTMNQVSSYMKEHHPNDTWKIVIQTVLSNVNATRMKRFYREIISNKFYTIDEHTSFFANLLHFPVEMAILSDSKERRDMYIQSLQIAVDYVKLTSKEHTFKHTFIYQISMLIDKLKKFERVEAVVSDEQMKQFHSPFDKISKADIIDILNI